MNLMVILSAGVFLYAVWLWVSSGFDSSVFDGVAGQPGERFLWIGAAVVAWGAFKLVGWYRTERQHLLLARRLEDRARVEISLLERSFMAGEIGEDEYLAQVKEVLGRYYVLNVSRISRELALQIKQYDARMARQRFLAKERQA
ncbi:MAG: hypothetical protein M1617_05005 [Actinobacteria bacterium]|nr:hypothetical protein [Actinomycetota bacterium]MCL5887648.1 hypothetical protein [Actinomycetota bacterium]